MAIVLDAFASYVGDLLKQVAQDEVGMMLGVSGAIAGLEEKLHSLKDFLSDAERRRITELHVQQWVRKLKDAMYAAADILDLCQLKAMERGEPCMDAGCLNPLLFCLRNPLFAHDIGSRIKALNARLDDIKESSAAFNFVNLGTYEDRRSSKVAPSRETTGMLDLSGVVGTKITEDTRKIVSMLMMTESTEAVPDKIKVVAIVGVGGIGKTTLAQMVFNDETIQRQFNKKIWLSVNKDFSDTELLRKAITAAGAGPLPSDTAKDTLAHTLKVALEKQRTLLVMDDVWSYQAWERVLKIPFVNSVAPGSRVLVTTRDDTVARGLNAIEPHHHVDMLEPKDAWALLKKQVVSSEMDEVESTLKDIGLQILEKCGGLPLAIIVVGGLLRQKKQYPADWEKVRDDSIWSVSQMPDEINNAVYISYEDLSPCLKQCFLHYSLLPKDSVFPLFKIVAMWISEGFLEGDPTDELEELGEKYYEELISRNLIQPESGYTDLWVCNMHDVVRSFAQYLARDEALVVTDTDQIDTKSHNRFIRLSVEKMGSQQQELEWSSLQKHKALRTLISCAQLKIKPGDSFAPFPSLRTLFTLGSINGARLVDTLHQLKHLRYISLEDSDMSRLPESIGKLKFLQFISLQGSKSLVRLPGSISKLGQLRYLSLSGTSISGIPKGFHGLKNLRTLFGFRAQVEGDWCSLEELGPLSHLRHLALEYLENVPSASAATKARLGEKARLSHLMLCCTSRLLDDGRLVKGISQEEQQQIEDVFNALQPPPYNLENLDITGYFGERLPKWMMSTSEMVAYKRLRVLTMKDLAYCTRLPDGLSQLPWLQILQIGRAPCIKRVGPEFLQLPAAPSQDVAIAFPKLKSMRLVGMVEWEEWEWELEQQLAHPTMHHAMPTLEDLLLERCKLKHFPIGLASQAKAFKVLSLVDVHQLKSLKRFSYLAELYLSKNPNLERIAYLPKLHKLTIAFCPRMKVVEGVPALQRLVLQDYDMSELPEYLQYVNPRHLHLDCSLEMLSSFGMSMYDKLKHIEHSQAYAPDGDKQRAWFLFYTRDTNTLQTNLGEHLQVVDTSTTDDD